MPIRTPWQKEWSGRREEEWRKLFYGGNKSMLAAKLTAGGEGEVTYCKALPQPEQKLAEDFDRLPQVGQISLSRT